MHYVIIGLIAIVAIILLIKFILFSPRANSVVMIIALIVGFILTLGNTPLTVIFIINIISIIDCIRDIVIAPEYYDDYGVDDLFALKSLLSLVTFGLARAVFLCIVGPAISYSVKSDIEERIRLNKPLPHKDMYNLPAKNYYYKKYIEGLKITKQIVSNENTVNEETKIRRQDLDKLYPKKVVEKIVDTVAGDKEKKSIRKICEEKLTSKVVKENYAYISKEAYDKLPELIIQGMTKKSMLSSRTICSLEELKPLNTTEPLKKWGKDNPDASWSEYFIIEVLEKLKKEGKFESANNDDSDPFNNPAYRYKKSEVEVKSINAEDNPLLALD